MKVCFLLFFFVASLVYSDSKSVKIEDTHRKFFTDYCVECHNAKKKKGKVRFDEEAFSFEIKTIQDADHWQKILMAINAGEMPPEDEKQPTPEDKLVFLEMLSGKLVEARKVLSDAGGKITMRRLNRREYVNTIREVLGVEIDASDLPADESGSTFDTDGGSLFMSSDQIEQYLAIARVGVKKALFTEQLAKPLVNRYQPEIGASRFIKKKRDDYLKRKEFADAYEKSKDPKKKAKDFGLIDERDVDIANNFYNRFFHSYDAYLNNPLSKTGILMSLFHPKPHENFTIGSYEIKKYIEVNGKKKKKKVKKWYPEGLYKIRARVSRTKNANPERSFLDFGVLEKGNEFKRLNSFHITAPQDKPEIIEAEFYMGENRKFSFREKTNDGIARYKYSQARKKNGVGPGQAIWIDWIEWEGPFKKKQPYAIANIAKKLKSSSKEQVIELLSNFAKNSFRGVQPSAGYIEKLYNIYQAERKAKKVPLEAIIEPLSIILASPSFLYITEPSGEKKSKHLTQRELAIRLAYFLWSSPPDKELIRLANNYQLRGEELSKQVDRMLKDPKVINFYRSFTYQWLGMERLNFFQFDVYLHPQFDDTLKSSAAEEVYQTVKTVVDENLSSSLLLKSDFVVINGMLAVHYGIPNVVGDEFRKVKLDKSSKRGGLTGMAAILAMGSDGKHTSPVERGAWVLRKILNQPPPPAPANVPQLNRLEGKKLNVRQMLKAHQEEPQCAHCHKKIDPLGFGLENFNATGRWRTIDRLNKLKTKVDPSGSLYKGPEFKSYLQLRDILHSRVDSFNKGLITNLIGYALGRPAGFSDQPFIEDLQKKMKESNNSIRALIHDVVKSEAFKIKK